MQKFLREIRFGEIEMSIGDEKIYMVDILAKEDVMKKGVFDYLFVDFPKKISIILQKGI